MATVGGVTVLANAPSGSTAPDSISVGGGFTWVAYTNGADSTGLSGSSTVVQYDSAGNVVHSYTVAGYVDGLKYDPFTGKVWALQNQDGNSTLSLIDPTTNTLSAPLSYSPSSATRGYDDVVFTANAVFLSYTNPPGTSGDATIVSLDQGNNPSGTLTTTTVLTDSMTGTNTVTGQTGQPVPETDPDSLKLGPEGDLLFSSGNDGALIDVDNPGSAGQEVSFTPVQGVTPGNAGLDDMVQPAVTSGTFLIADTADNRVLSVHITNLNLSDYYGSVGSLSAFGELDPTTGVFTPLVSAANAPGGTFGSPHGVEFIPDVSPYSFQTLNNNADLTFNQLLGINNAGTIAGYFGIGQTPATPNAPPNKGYTLAPPYTQASYTNENFPGSAQTQVVGINSFGLTVGFWVDNNTAFDNFGFVDNGGAFTSVVDPNTPAVAGAVNQLLGVNDLGEAAGFYVDANGNSNGYIYDIATATFTPVTISGATSVTATGINNEGVISGFETLTGGAVDGFIDNNGSITTLTGPAGATLTEAFGLNNEGQVVGEYTDGNGNTHGFVYNVATGVYTTIDDPNATPSTPGAATMTVVNGINDLGQLVGFYLDANGNTDGMLAAIPGTIATITNPTAGSKILMPAGYGGVILQGNNSVTLTDSGTGNALLQGNQGNDTITATGASDTLIGGNGNNVIAGAGGTNVFSLGGGQNLVFSSGTDRITSGGGADTIFASSSVTFLGASAGSLTFISGAGSNTLLTGGEAATIFGGTGNGSVVFAGSGRTEYIGGSGSAEFVGGSGSATVFGGSGNDVIFAGPGGGVFVGQANTSNEIVAAGGPSTVVANAGNSAFLGGSASNVALAGAGNVTLDGSASSGNDAFFAGSGNDQISGGSGKDAIFAGTGSATMSGGGGGTFFGFVNGLAGGTDVITNFKLGTDIVGLTGYGSGEVTTALNGATVADGSTTITLTDGTHIAFLGVTNLTSSAFVSS